MVYGTNIWHILANINIVGDCWGFKIAKFVDMDLDLLIDLRFFEANNILFLK